METRNPFADFSHNVEERITCGSISGKSYKTPIRYEWTRNNMCQMLSATLVANGNGSFCLGVYMLCRNFGKPQIYNSAEIAVVRNFYDSDEMIRRIISGIHESKKVWGMGSRLDISFFLEREGIDKVKVVAHVTVDGVVREQSESNALSVDDALLWIEYRATEAPRLICEKFQPEPQ